MVDLVSRKKDRRFATRAVRAGQSPDPSTGSTVPPVYQTSTFTRPALGEHKGYEYARLGNPTRSALEEALVSLEEGRVALAYASGMAAISGVVQTLSQGDHVVVGDDLYGGTFRLFTQVIPRFGIDFSFVDATNLDAVRAEMRPTTKQVWIETPTNPIVRIIDIAGCAEIARASSARMIVDNTFATPFFQRPLTLGAAGVVHSTTKYLGGHSDVIGGAAIVDDEAWGAEINKVRLATGSVPGPWDIWLTLRGIKTLAVRMRQHERNADKVAHYLRGRPEVAAVHYPGFEDHPGHAIAAAQMDGFGGMIAIDLHGGLPAAKAVCEGTQIFSLAESLGGVGSLVGHPWTMSHAAFSESHRLQKGIGEGTLRLSIGIEDADDLCDDLGSALDLI